MQGLSEKCGYEKGNLKCQIRLTWTNLSLVTEFESLGHKAAQPSLLQQALFTHCQSNNLTLSNFE